MKSYREVYQITNGLQKKANDYESDYLPLYAMSHNIFTDRYLNSIYQRIPKSDIGQRHKSTFAESYAPTGARSKSGSSLYYVRQRRGEFIKHLLDIRYPELKKGSSQYNDIYEKLNRSGDVNYYNFKNKYFNNNNNNNTYPSLDYSNGFHPLTIRKYDEMKKWIANNKASKVNPTVA